MLHLVDEDAASVVAYLIHHVERQYHRCSKFHELHGEVEVALDVVGIHDVDDGLGFLLHDELPRDDFLGGVGRKGVNSRQISDLRVGVPFDGAVLAVNGHAGEVAHMLVGTRQLVEEGCLAAVLLSGKGKGQNGAFGQRVFVGLVVINAFLAQAWVGVVVVQGGDIELVIVLMVNAFGLVGRIARLHFDELGIGFAERERVAVHHDFHRVA